MSVVRDYAIGSVISFKSKFICYTKPQRQLHLWKSFVPLSRHSSLIVVSTSKSFISHNCPVTPIPITLHIVPSVVRLPISQTITTHRKPILTVITAKRVLPIHLIHLILVSSLGFRLFFESGETTGSFMNWSNRRAALLKANKPQKFGLCFMLLVRYKQAVFVCWRVSSVIIRGPCPSEFGRVVNHRETTAIAATIQKFTGIALSCNIYLTSVNKIILKGFRTFTVITYVTKNISIHFRIER